MSHGDWSVPETEVMRRIRERLGSDGSDVLATIVDVEGNAYRRPGAKMLVEAGGSGVGTITAGCLADELLSTAETVRERGRPALRTYDLRNDDDDVWGLGAGCNGVVDVLLEPLRETHRPAVEAYHEGRDVAAITVLSGNGELARGDRAYYYPAGASSNANPPDGGRFEAVDGSPNRWSRPALAAPARRLATSGGADAFELDADAGTVRLFVDGIAAPPEVVVFGTGHDVTPVTELAAKNGFRVTVVGFRGAADLGERFPHAERTLTTSPAAVAEELPLDGERYAVVMTHNFVDDRLVVEQCLDASMPYVGLMGPRERFDRMLDAFEDEGRRFTEAELSPLYTPVGLDLGSGSPYGIAHGIVAELLAVHNDRKPQHLRTRTGDIHDRVDVEAVDDGDDAPAAGGDPVGDDAGADGRTR